MRTHLDCKASRKIIQKVSFSEYTSIEKMHSNDLDWTHLAISNWVPNPHLKPWHQATRILKKSLNCASRNFQMWIIFFLMFLDKFKNGILAIFERKIDNLFSKIFDLSWTQSHLINKSIFKDPIEIEKLRKILFYWKTFLGCHDIKQNDIQ